MTKNLCFSLTPTFSPLINLYIFTLFLLARNALCIDPKYLACEPKTCGDGQSISFPFYIHGQQEPFCGQPGFNLSCNNKGNPVLKLPDNDYIIHKIFYNNHSLRVSNAAVFDTNTACVPPIQNISLPDENFKLVDTQTMLYLLYNCNTSSLPENLLDHTVNCSGDQNKTKTVTAIYEGNPNLSYASNTCTNGAVAVTPVDISGNESDNDIGKLLASGFVLKWIATDCSVCEGSGGKCGYDDSDNRVKCYCPDRPHYVRCNSGTTSKLVMIIAIAASAAGIGVLMIIVYCFRRRFPSYKFIQKKKPRDCQNVEAFFRNNAPLVSKRYSYSEVKKMTNSFRVKLGQGGYGGVYKGKLNDGRLVAVKVLNESKGNGEEFINEVASISRTSHVNIVTLLGFCFEGSKRALIYEFMPNGSLEKFIYGETPSNADRLLGWESLYQIAFGIAKGLEYLHRGCNTRILHFDIKPHNILLDEEFSPKISDFGLAKICPRKESIISMTGARGTAGYIAPEVFCRNFGRISHKSDVYSYGMMVLEMVGGRKNICVGVDRTSEIYFPLWICKRLELGEELQLQGVRDEEEKKIARKMILVGLWCIQTDPSNRPPMSRVVEMLQGSVESLPIPPTPFLSSPPRTVENSSTTSITTL